MKLRNFVLALCFTGIPLTGLDIGRICQRIDRVPRAPDQVAKDEILQELNSATFLTKGLLFHDAKIRIDGARSTLTNKQDNLSQKDINMLNRKIHITNRAFNSIKNNLIQAITNIDVDAYTQEHDVTPVQFIEKLITGTWSNDDVVAYTKYRIAHRLQQRILHNEASLFPDDQETHADMVKSGADETYDIDKLAQELEDTVFQDNIDAIIHFFLPGSIETTNLPRTNNQATSGCYTRNQLRNKILLDSNNLHSSPINSLHVIEHEITHMEEERKVYVNTTPFGVNNMSESARKEYAADYEAARFAPLAYCLQLEKGSMTHSYYEPLVAEISGISYPPVEWIHNVLAERAQHLSRLERLYHRFLYLQEISEKGLRDRGKSGLHIVKTCIYFYFDVKELELRDALCSPNRYRFAIRAATGCISGVLSSYLPLYLGAILMESILQQSTYHITSRPYIIAHERYSRSQTTTTADTEANKFKRELKANTSGQAHSWP